MVRKLKALLVIALCLPLVGAWPNTGKKYAGVVATYSGPGNVVSGATAWWGLRAYTAAIAAAATQKVVNLIRASDSHTCDIIIATSGGLGNTGNCSTGGDNGQSASSFCNATTCSVTALYDQTLGNNCASASCDVVQATAADQPALTFSCINSLPCIDTSGGSFFLLSPNSLTLSQPFTLASTIDRTTNFAAFNDAISDAAINIQDGWTNSANTGFLGAGSVGSFTLNDSAVHNRQSVYNGASSQVYFDGTNPALSGNPGTASLSRPQLFATNGDTTNHFKGHFGEAGAWPTGFNSTQAGNMCHNQFTFWSGAASC